MAHQISCITNNVADLRSCTVRGVHKSNCDGFAREYDPETHQTALAYEMLWNPDTRENERILIECKGCAPRPAEHGLVCSAHFSKIENALEYLDGNRLLVDLVTHLWSIESGGTAPESEGSSGSLSSTRWPLAESRIIASQIVAEMISVVVAHASDWGKPEPRFHLAMSVFEGIHSAASVETVAFVVRPLVDYLEEIVLEAIGKRHGAKRVVSLVDTVQGALRRFPLVETKPRMVPGVRCPKCRRIGMLWQPPLYQDDDVVIRCGKCGNEESQEWLESYVANVKTDPRRRTS